MNRVVRAEREGKDVPAEKLLKNIFKAEKVFLSALRSSGNSTKVYQALARMVNLEKHGNSCKLYFRVKYGPDSTALNKLVGRLEIGALKKLPINYKFCAFAMQEVKEPTPTMVEAFDGLIKAREKLINKFLLLSLHMTKTQSGKLKNDEFYFQDLMQICNEALIESIDKYVQDEASATFMQRAAANMIYHIIQHSTSMNSVNFSQKESRLLFKIRKAIQSFGPDKYKEIADFLKVTEEEVYSLMATESSVSLSEFEDRQMIGQSDDNPEENVIDINMKLRLNEACEELSLLEIKALKLMGIQLKIGA